VFEDKRPDPLGESASLRLAWILELAHRLGYPVAVYSVRERTWLSPRWGRRGVPEQFVPSKEPATQATVAWVGRPDAAAVVLPVVAAAGGIRVVYDSIDLQYRRFEREAAVTGSRGRALQAPVMRRLEKQAAAAADLTIAVTDDEVSPLRELGASMVRVFPNVHAPREDPVPPRVTRSGLVFVGNFAHSPNVDAVEVLVAEVMPRLWARRPALELSIVGRAFPADHFGELDARIAVYGWVPDLETLLDAALVLVAPLRFGAGLKGKVGFALARGLPVVTTTLGAEGFADLSGMVVCEVGDGDAFARHVLELVDREDFWTARSEAGVETVRRHFSPEALESELEAILEGA
jgi:glycosyltransferase involved in cell wall biosynthesis